jgi:hypothetical protein
MFVADRFCFHCGLFGLQLSRLTWESDLIEHAFRASVRLWSEVQMLQMSFIARGRLVLCGIIELPWCGSGMLRPAVPLTLLGPLLRLLGLQAPL